MADIIKTKSTLSLEQEFTDGDTRTITLDNPCDSIQAADSAAVTAINEVGTYMKTNKLTVGDKVGADFLRFKSAKVNNHTTVYLDLTQG